jgi:hypothetical protein
MDRLAAFGVSAEKAEESARRYCQGQTGNAVSDLTGAGPGLVRNAIHRFSKSERVILRTGPFSRPMNRELDVHPSG